MADRTPSPEGARDPARDPGRTTRSGEPLDAVYGPDRLEGWSADERLGAPGAFPFTRGVYPSMYRGRVWTMRQFAGYGSPAETNERFRVLLERGQTGLSVAFDMPTLMGLDADDPRAEGEVGKCGVAVSSVDDALVLFEQIPLDDVTVSMTINGPAAWLFACYLVAAERQGVAWSTLDGTLQTDIFKEYTAQKEWLFPPRPHLRLIGDLMAFCADQVPKYHPVSVSGYHIREAGSTAAQELAFTLADGFAYVELGIDRGLPVDRFASQLSFFFDAHIDVFEEVAKFRAARRIWARWLRDRYGAADPASQRLRFHTQTAGVSLTAQQPMNNVVRTAIEALAAVLGGTQSLHTNALDEVLALPTEEAATLALRTQQVLAFETGVADVVDPLAGSYFVESLTDTMEARAEEFFARIDRMGEGSMLEGVLRGVESGWFTREIAEAAFDEQRRYERGDLVQVGVNAFVDPDEPPLEILRIGAETERAQRAAVARTRAQRDAAAAERALEALTAAAIDPAADLMWPLIACARARCTGGEVTRALQGVFGAWREVPAF
jgi:methylmalonyl-CoA mutase, N-terminal domain